MNITNLTTFLCNTPVTFVLMFLIFAVSMTAIFRKKLLPDLMLHPYTIVNNRQYYRFLSADLVHVDLLHLILNEIFLYIFCTDLEEMVKKHHRYGSMIFFGIYLTSMLCGAILTTLRHYKDFNYSSAGASGSIMGCLFGFMLLNPFGSLLHLPVIGNVPNVYCGLIYFVIMLLYRQRAGNKMVNTELHFFGALGGLVATGLLCKIF